MKNRSKSEVRPQPTRWLLAGAAALALYGCDKTAADQPANALAPVAQGAPIVDAPVVDALPPAAAVPVSEVTDPRAAYAFADRAYEMSDMFGDAPPDYVYDHNGYQPWVWVSDDGSERVVENVPGGERYYYYEAGADEPFFIQDPSYGYGFEGGRLVAVYDRSGRILPVGGSAARAQIAGRYLTQGRALYAASRHDTHLPVAQSNWMARRGAIRGQHQTWQRQIGADPNWGAFHAQNAPAVEAHWVGERAQRLKWAAHVDEAMHNQAYATQERQQAQAVAARPLQPSPSPSHDTSAAPHPLAVQPAAPHRPDAASPHPVPQDHFAQRPQSAPPEVQGRPHEDVARQEHAPHGSNPEGGLHIAPAPARSAPPHEARAKAERAMPPPARPAQVARHEPPPQVQPRAAQMPVHEAPVVPPARLAVAPRHETPPPQAPAAPRMAMAPRPQAAPSPSGPPPAPSARAERQQAAGPPKAHPAKEDKHKE